MISQTRQRFATIGIVAVAFAALFLGAVYSGDGGQTDSPYIVGGTQANSGSAAVGNAAPAQPGDEPAVSTTPIDGFLPKSGAASACQEPIGVDLATGYGARLTINGTEIQPEDMNVVRDDDGNAILDEDGNISRTQTAGRSIGHYTFAADDNCPNGPLIRARDNLLEVCVYRLSDTSEACIYRTSNEFDAT